MRLRAADTLPGGLPKYHEPDYSLVEALEIGYNIEPRRQPQI